MMTEGMKPFLVKGDAAREAAWQRLMSGQAAGSAAFRRRERLFSVVWGWVVGAYTVPVDTMVWLGSVVLVVAMVIGFVVGGALAAGPMEEMLTAEAAADRAERPAVGAAA